MLETDCDECGKVFVSDYLYKIKNNWRGILLVCNPCLETFRKMETKIKREKELLTNKHKLIEIKPFTNLFE